MPNSQQSISAQTLRNAASLQQARSAIESRLIALPRAHDVLTRQNWEGAELREIAAQALKPYSSRNEDRLHLSGPTVRLPPQAALAMAFQELATNAVKVWRFVQRYWGNPPHGDDRPSGWTLCPTPALAGARRPACGSAVPARVWHPADRA